VQTSRAAGSQSASSSSPTVQRVDGPVAPTGAAPAANTPSPARSERDLDELAKALFGRIRTRLRNDLLHDREAAGFTFDNV
jgi:hypothetical protein